MAVINSDPEVTRYLNRPVDDHAIAGFSDAVTGHWTEHGFGFYALEGRRGEFAGCLLGFVGIALPEFVPELSSRPELGWRLAHSAWGRGFAFEAASAVLDAALSRPGFPELISIIHPDNFRSRRLAARLGMTVERSVSNPVLERDVEVWAIDASVSAGRG